MSAGSAERGQDQSAPQQVPLPDELREFLEVVHLLANGLEDGTYQLSGPEDRLVWDDITWSQVGVFCTRMIGFPYDSLAEFEFRYQPRFLNGLTEWEFDLSRGELARIAGGAVSHLSLYACANPVCGYMSSSRWGQCPRCHLEAGTRARGPHPHRVLGICPYCGEPLRTLDSQQCRHCRTDWHDPDHPVPLGR